MRARGRMALMAVALLTVLTPAAAQAQGMPGASEITPQYVDVAGIEPGYYSCWEGEFCAWSELNAGGYGTAYYPYECDERYNFTDEYNDWIDSIWNRTAGVTVHVQNWVDSEWKDLWVSQPGDPGEPGNWGNLPYDKRNKADALLFNC